MAILTINEIVYDFSKELGFESLNDNDFLKGHNTKRVFENNISFDKQIADLLQHLAKIGLPILENILVPKISKFFDNIEEFDLFNIYRKYLELESSINLVIEFKPNVFNKIISQNSTKEEIFFEIFKYVFIPLFINILNKETLHNFKKLLPDKENTILQQFLKLIKDDIDFSISLAKIEANEVSNNLDESAIISNFRKAISRSKENREQQIPITFEYIVKHFPNSPTLLTYFIYAKLINFMFKSFGKEKGCQLVSYIEDLIDNPDKNENKDIFSLNMNFALEKINSNLAKNKSDKLDNFLKKIKNAEQGNNSEFLLEKYSEFINFGQTEEMIGYYLQNTQHKYKVLSRKFHTMNKVESEKFVKPLLNTVTELSQHQTIFENELEIISAKFDNNETFKIQDIKGIFKKHNFDFDKWIINQDAKSLNATIISIFDKVGKEPSMENMTSAFSKKLYPKTTNKEKKIVLGNL